MRHQLTWALLGSSLALSACVTGGGAGGSGGGQVVVPVSGGPIGATCPKEDQIGCAPGANAKVRCKSGVWVDDGICSTSESCVETKSGELVTATQCATPPTANTSRAIMCAKADHCLPMSFSTCMHPPSPATAAKVASLMGVFEPDDLLMLNLDKWQTCIAAATDCAGVRQCTKGGNLACPGNGQKASTCSGSMAQFCQDTTSIAVDCGLVGLPCVSFDIGGAMAAMCGKLAPCSAPKTFACSGSVAKVCSKVSDTLSLSFDIDCGQLGAACDPTAKFDDDPDVCKFPGGATCDPETFVESCSGTKATECKSGKTRVLDCAALGAVCVISNSLPVANASCSTSPACAGGSSSSSDNLVKFCDGPAGYRSFDCALAGMEFSGFGCKFPGEAP
ncbi:MAG: hypothetical protein FJ100_23980 [Deltaproteobacteria bacterium]|nr:hypothetical protein [Deltaproteobacteria bacterium]